MTEIIRESPGKAKLYLITLPADGSWTEAIDTFGFNRLTPLLADLNTDENFSASFQTSANGSIWRAYEESSSFSTQNTDGWHTTSYDMSISIQIFTGSLAFIVAPYIRFSRFYNETIAFDYGDGEIRVAGAYNFNGVYRDLGLTFGGQPVYTGTGYFLVYYGGVWHITNEPDDSGTGDYVFDDFTNPEGYEKSFYLYCL